MLALRLHWSRGMPRTSLYRKHHTLWLGLAALVMLFTARSARASEATLHESSAFAARPLAIEAELGLGTPLGLYGVALDYAPMPWLSLNAGVGKAAVGGTQVGFMPRLRQVSGDVGLAVGFGVSTGSTQSPVVCFWGCGQRTWEDVVWMNPELSLDVRSKTGFVFRMFGGAQIPVSRGRCVSGCYDQSAPYTDTRPYLGVALGAALPRFW